MKEGIHPEYIEATVTCGCGNKVVTRSTRKNLKVEICSKCHPFYSGKQKLVDTAGRVERFRRKYGLLEKADEKTKSPETVKLVEAKEETSAGEAEENVSISEN